MNIIESNAVFLLAVFAEIEAKEACDWLRAAGFPQYVQLFKGKYEPVNVILCHTTCRVSSNRLDPNDVPGSSYCVIFPCLSVRLQVPY